MIIKGKSRGNGAQLGKYLVTRGENEIIRVVEIRGVSAVDVPAAVLEMDALAAGSRTKKGLYHAHINTLHDERMTDEQRSRAVDCLETALGLAGQPRVVVVHQKKGREHCHVVWSRINLDRMAAIPDSHNYRKHEEVARELERAFGFRRVQGAHAERDGQARPRRSPDQAETQQSERTGFGVQRVKREITGLWRTTDSGRAFVEALAQAGYILACGDRRDFVVIDPNGGTHSLTRRIEGAKAKDIRVRMADVDASQLPSVAEAKEMQLSRQGYAPKIPRKSSGDAASETGPIPRMDGPRHRPVGRNSDMRGSFRSAAREAFHPAKRSAQKKPEVKEALTSRRRIDPNDGFSTGSQRTSFAARQYLLPSTRGTIEIHSWTTDGANLRGEFRGQAVWLPLGPNADVGDAGVIASEGDPGGDDDLGQILSAIAAEVQGKAAGARAGIIAEYAGKIASARSSLPRREVAGVVRALTQARAAALAHIGREAAREIGQRREAAIQAHRKQPRRPKPLRNGPGPRPTQH